MEVLKITNGRETVSSTHNYTHGYLQSVTKPDGEVIHYNKPTFPGEYSSSINMDTNFNYDGLHVGIKYDKNTKVFRGRGYGWTELEFVLFKEPTR